MARPIVALIEPDCVMTIHKNPKEFVDHLCSSVEKHKGGEVCEGFVLFDEGMREDPAIFRLVNALRALGLKVEIS